MGSHKFFIITVAEGEVEVEPDTSTDDFRWEAVAFVKGGYFHALIIPYPARTLSTHWLT